MSPDGRRRRPPCRRPRGAALVAALCGALPLGARATVSPDQGELPAPTVVVMQQADLATLGAGVRARPGDYRLEYGTVAFIVSQPGAAGRREPGGGLVDAVQLFPSPRRLGIEQLAQRGAIYVRATVSRSRDLATVALEGYDGEDPQLEVRTQYQLGPVLKAPDALRIVTTVRNAGTGVKKGYEIGDTLRWGALARFLPGAGLATPAERRAVSFLEGLGPAGALLYLPGGAALGALGGGEASAVHGASWSDVRGAAADLRPGQSASFSRLVQVASDPGRVLCQGAALAGKLPVRGAVREDGDGAPGALVTLERSGGDAIAATLSGDGGRFWLCAPSPGAYRLRAEAPGRAAAPLAVQVGPGGAPESTLALGRAARLRVSVREAAPDGRSRGPDGRGRPVTARLSLTPLDGQPPRAVSAGSLPTFAEGNLARVIATGGEADLILPPGRYRAAASRGPFYEVAGQDVALKPGESRKLQLTLRRGVPPADTLSVRCASLRSIGAGAPSDAALAVARAEGLDVLLAEGAEAEGAREGVHVVSAAEVASARGRFLAYPLGPGAVVPELRQVGTAAGVIEALRRLPGEGGEPPIVQGWPGEGEAKTDAVTIWTGAAPDPAALRGWLARLDEGAPQTAVAAADPRAGLAGLAAPRTCYTEAQSARPLSPAAHLRAALRRGDAVLTNGPWLRVSANGAEPGELAAAPDGKVAVLVTVLAAPPMDVREIEVWVGGRRAAQAPVPPTGTPLRYRGTLRVTIDKDAAIVVTARGNRPLDPLVPGAAPFALSNPVFVDRDGDGRFGKAARPGGSRK